MAPLRAILKSAVSGDTIILRGPPRTNGPPAERQLSLNFITAPRLSYKKDSTNEPFAFESRDFLRSFIGKEVTFTVHYTTSSGREFGNASIEGKDLVRESIAEGWTSLREDARYNEEDLELVEELKILQEAAKGANKGIWNKKEKPVQLINSYPEDLRQFLNQFKGKKLPAIIEQVRDGSTLRLNVQTSNPENSELVYQSIMLQMSGIKAPIVRRGVTGMEDLVEPFGEEAKYLVESRLLQKDIHVILEGLSNSNLCGSIIFPAGSISELLVSRGLAKVVDWSIIMVTEGPQKLRAAEKAAKEKKLKLWQNHTKVTSAPGQESVFEGTVVRIATPDQIHVLSKTTNIEKKIQFSSVRAPRLKNPDEAPYVPEVREFLRKMLIGKQVKVKIDYVKPPSDGFEERHCASVVFNSKDIGEVLVAKGYASVIRHRHDDDDRSSNFDALLAAEETAKTSAVGMHSNKKPPVSRITDASESLAKAKQFLSFLQRSGRVRAVVEHISNASRFKLFVPTQNCKLTFVLSGIRAPKVGRTPQESSDPFGVEALNFVSQIAMQRDVEIEVETTDKNGGFIGSLWLTSKTNLACKLLENGYAITHLVGANQSQNFNALLAAEKTAKSKNLRIWTTIKEDVVEETSAEKDQQTPAEKVRLVVSDMVDGSQFSIQVIGKEIQLLESLMSEFAVYHSSVASATSSFTPKSGVICSAQFTQDNQWYRARIRKLIPGKTADVVYIDYGNSETIPVSRLRSLPEKFSQLKPQAMEARLAYLQIPSFTEDYGPEAFDILRDMLEGREFEGTIEAKSQNVAHIVAYTDSKNSIKKSINAKIVQAGYGVLHKPKRLVGPLRFRENHIQALSELQDQAKKSRAGRWEFGDIADQDDDDIPL